MAIDQARIISLLNAAIDYRQAFVALCARIAQAEAATVHKPADAAEHLHRVYLRAGPGMLEKPTDSETVIVKEWNHFRVNARRNERVAEVQRRKRRELGIPERKQLSVGFLPIKGRVDQYEIDDGSESEFEKRHVEYLDTPEDIGLSQANLSEATRKRIDEEVEQEALRQQLVKGLQERKGKRSASEVIAEASRLGLDVSDGKALEALREGAREDALRELAEIPPKPLPTEVPTTLAGFDLEDDDGEEVGGVRHDD